MNNKTMLRAKTSKRKFGGQVEDYLELHKWFDSVSHPALRHHSQGIFEAEKRFGVTITNSNGKVIPTRILCEEHIKEDIGFIPTAQEWIQNMELHKWMGFRDKEIINYSKKNSKIKTIMNSY